MKNPQITCRTAAIGQSFCALMISIALGSSAQSQIPCRYEIAHIIQGPGCSNPSTPSSTFGTAISPDGHWVVGYFIQCPLSENRAFYYDTTTREFHSIPLGPGFYSSSAADVNNDGVVVGTGNRTNIGQRGFVYRIATGEWTELLPLPGGVYSSATGINSSGVVCGWRSIGPGTNPTTAFYWTQQNGFTDLGLINGQSTSAADINDGNVVTGRMVVNSQVHPFLWDQRQVQDLGTLAEALTFPYALNNANQVVGQSATIPPYLNPHAFLATTARIFDLGTLPGHDWSHGLAISRDGTVVGLSQTQGGADERAVIWTARGIKDLNMILQNSAGIFLSEAAAITDEGFVLANGFSASTSNACILQPTYAPLADITGDCRVNVRDLLAVINAWGICASCPADVNADGAVNQVDLVLVIQQWTVN